MTEWIKALVMVVAFMFPWAGNAQEAEQFVDCDGNLVVKDCGDGMRPEIQPFHAPLTYTVGRAEDMTEGWMVSECEMDDGNVIGGVLHYPQSAQQFTVVGDHRGDPVGVRDGIGLRHYVVLRYHSLPGKVVLPERPEQANDWWLRFSVRLPIDEVVMDARGMDHHIVGDYFAVFSAKITEALCEPAAPAEE